MLVDKTFLHKLLLKNLIKSIIHLFSRKEKRKFKKSVSLKTLIL
ncbi:OxaA precursor [Streptococcus mitis]|uniref:OxaA n=1 Tax=Streptococcus mitis TaxID=28037 RepID=A0A1T0C4Z6_STRMT|nr:OxaA precursor [Streptococcus mitis]